VRQGEGGVWATRDAWGFQALEPAPGGFRPTGLHLPETSSLLAPVTPSKIVCIGLNYHSHARELQMPVPEVPLVFLKPPTALAGPGDAIAYPDMSRQVDYEGELAVVMGRGGRNIPEAQALDHVLGYTLANDVTARDLQKQDGQWTRAKGFDGFCPVGPCVAMGLNPDQLELRTYLNGQLKQRGLTTDFIFNVAEIVAFVSRIMTLLPGDLILTGTPPGVGPMLPGDTVRVECDAIGVLQNFLQ
jgi:2-keto-4-pentenoate hydratase/2-oxohepta-3-ene-1,7-dioic acid hydratase in catechol pathway